MIIQNKKFKEGIIINFVNTSEGRKPVVAKNYVEMMIYYCYYAPSGLNFAEQRSRFKLLDILESNLENEEFNLDNQYLKILQNINKTIPLSMNRDIVEFAEYVESLK